MTDFSTTATTLGRAATAKIRTLTDASPLTSSAKDVLYTAIGTGLIGVQKINVARKKVVDLAHDLPVDTAGIHAAGTEIINDLHEHARATTQRLGDVLKSAEHIVSIYEEKLPEPVQKVTSTLRSVLTGARASDETETTPSEEA